MSDTLRRRISGRIDALGINPFEADRRAGLKRGYTNDLLIGKKHTMREKALVPLAGALECDLEFLTGGQDTPRKADAGRVKLSGVVEAGTWRDADGETYEGEELPSLPVPADPRFPVDQTKLYVVRGDHAAGLGINGGSVVWVLPSDGPFREGDIVLAQRERDSQVERSIRVIVGGALSARPLRGAVPDIPLSSASIVGLVVSAIRLFGIPH